MSMLEGLNGNGFDQEEFNQFVLEHDVIGFFDKPITLKSGRQSHWYVNWRKPTEDVALTLELADHIIDFTHHYHLSPDTFYGVPEGATKIAIATQLTWAQESPHYKEGSHVLSMGRGKIKEHGKPEDRYFLGVPRGKTIVIEDVTTTGGSLIDTTSQLLEANVNVIAAYGLTNRMERRDDGLGVEEALAKIHIPYLALSNAIDVLPRAYQHYKPDQRIVDAVEQEFRQYGVKPLTLNPKLEV